MIWRKVRRDAAAAVAPAICLRQRKVRHAGAGHDAATMARKFPLDPPHPERTCWGCDRYCPRGDMACGNGSERTQHPVELFGQGWESGGLDPLQPLQAAPSPDADRRSP